MTDIKQRSAYAAAAHILRHDTLNAEGYLDDVLERIWWDRLFEKSTSGYYSGGEVVLVEAAHAMWSGWSGGESKVAEVMHLLDDAAYQRVVEAMLALRPVVVMPPVGMIPYMPAHSHGPEDPCPGEMYCPFASWAAHIAVHGNPYPATRR